MFPSGLCLSLSFLLLALKFFGLFSCTLSPASKCQLGSTKLEGKHSQRESHIESEPVKRNAREMKETERQE